MAARRHPVQHPRHRLNHHLNPAPRQAPCDGVGGHSLKLQIADSVPVNSHADGVCAVRRTSGSGSRPRRRCAPHRGMSTRYLEARLADIWRMSVSEKVRVEPRVRPTLPATARTASNVPPTYS
jgi:hypothetical protein